MSQLIPQNEESISDIKDVKSQLTTEEEVRMLKKELAQKEKELESFREKPQERTVVIAEKQKKEEDIKKEKEKIRISPDDPNKAKLSQKITKPAKVKKINDDIADDLKEIMSMDKPKQVKTLVYLAFKKGVNYAANIADQLRDPYLLDEFHDTLVDNLYDLLKKKKKI